MQEPDTEIAGLKHSNAELQYYELPFNLIPIVYWRLDKPPFNDPRVRQAVSMSLNRDNQIGVLSTTGAAAGTTSSCRGR